METAVNPALPPRCCGKCNKTFRMRDASGSVLCTAILEVVEACFADVCEHYVERRESLGYVPPKRL